MSTIGSGNSERKAQKKGRSSYSNEAHIDVFQDEGLELFLKASELWLLIVRAGLLYLCLSELCGTLMILIVFVDASMDMELVHLVC